eukprot:363541-Prymnesium_polylepis.1
MGSRDRSPQVSKYAERATTSLVDAGRTVNEAMMNLRTIAAFGLHQERSGAFARQLELPLKQDITKGVAIGVGGGVAAGAILLSAALQYVCGALFFDAGIVDFNSIMRVLLVLIFMAFGLGQISRDATDKAEALLAAKRVHKLLQLKSAIDPLDVTAAPPAAPCEGKLQLVDVDFAYPARRE